MYLLQLTAEETILRTNKVYFLLKHWWVARSERERDLALLTGVWIYKPFALS